VTPLAFRHLRLEFHRCEIPIARFQLRYLQFRLLLSLSLSLSLSRARARAHLQDGRCRTRRTTAGPLIFNDVSRFRKRTLNSRGRPHAGSRNRDPRLARGANQGPCSSAKISDARDSTLLLLLLLHAPTARARARARERDRVRTSLD
jgi:hypothetical protein